MKKNILVISYSQTGQLDNVVDHLLFPLKQEGNHIDHIKLDSIYNYSFPWSMKTFFSVFPESVLHHTEPHFMLPYDKQYDKPYDLVVLGYQPWFLSPSIPMSSFLHSEFAQRILAGKNILTVVACRNMWTQAQEDIKGLIKQVKANLVGNIVLYDKAYNFVSLYTILRWMLYGKKGDSGVAKSDIDRTTQYGEYIKKALANSEPIEQKKLVAQGAVTVIPHLALMEGRGKIIFSKLAQFINRSSTSRSRQFRTKLFQIYLMIAIFILSPLSLIASLIIYLFFPGKYKALISHYSGVD